MPVHRVSVGWQYGRSGKVYRSKKKAEAQARAIFASGYRDDARARHAAHQKLTASRKAETRYALDLARIMGRLHGTVRRIVDHETARAGALHQDAPSDVVRAILAKLREVWSRLSFWVRQQTEEAFDRMSRDVEIHTTEAHSVIGIAPRLVAGVASVIDHARAANVKLITRASDDFLHQVRRTLEENEGARYEEIAELLEERVVVSKSRAVTIARTETVKLNSQISEHRQRAAGVRKYRWSTSSDERVRPEHAELDGEVFSWDNPNVSDDGVENRGDVDGGPCHPGQTINCRCVPIPIVEELEEPEAAEAEEEPYAAAAE